jgi:dTDP-4-amino-4,6-dideoxygalactose transaminase
VPSSVKDLILEDVSTIITSGHFLKGSFTAALEDDLSRRHAGASVTCVGNGTDALYIALASIGVGPGTQVATVANAGGYTSGATLRLGARPVMVDVDQSTAQMSVTSLEMALRAHPDIKVVVATHLYGLVGDIEPISELCSRRGIPLIEDCAQSFGAVVDGRPAGTFGDMATFSFYPTKNLGAFGDAGAVITSDTNLASRVASLAQYGWSHRYSVDLRNGTNSRIDEIQAAILLRLVPFLDNDNRTRRDIVLAYHEALGGGRRMIHSPDSRFVGHLAVLLTDSRDADRSTLESAGVATGIHYPVIDTDQTAWEGCIDSADLPATRHIQDRILTLPCFPGMTGEEIEQVVNALRGLV